MLWNRTYMWFLFSYPATWDLDTSDAFWQTIDRTAFKSTEYHRTVPLSLKQAQAAMSSYLCENKADITKKACQDIIVADIGGATVDVSMFTMNGNGRSRTGKKRYALQELSPPIGRYHGSARIDSDVKGFLAFNVELECKSHPWFSQLGGSDK